MTDMGVKEYRRDMAAVHDEVVRTGEPAVITRDGLPLVKIVPASAETTLAAVAAAGRVSLAANHRRQPVTRSRAAPSTRRT